jgi:hypothetical protein
MRNKTLLITSFISLTVMLLLSGCEGRVISENEVKTTGNASNPCKLITKSQVEKIFKESFKDPEDKSPNNHPLGQKIYFFDAVNERSFSFLQLSLIIGDQAKTIYYDTKKLTDGKEVNGYGDSAFWASLGLHVLTKNIFLNIYCGNSSKPVNLERAKKVAFIV